MISEFMSCRISAPQYFAFFARYIFLFTSHAVLLMLISGFIFGAAGRIREDREAYKCWANRLFWIDYNENSQGLICDSLIWHFSVLWSSLHYIHIYYIIGCRSNRKADRRWSKTYGTWCWTDSVAHSSWGNNPFLVTILILDLFVIFSKKKSCFWSLGSHPYKWRLATSISGYSAANDMQLACMFGVAILTLFTSSFKCILEIHYLNK